MIGVPASAGGGARCGRWREDWHVECPYLRGRGSLRLVAGGLTVCVPVCSSGARSARQQGGWWYASRSLHSGRSSSLLLRSAQGYQSVRSLIRNPIVPSGRGSACKSRTDHF
jgi:hypothetical protein